VITKTFEDWLFAFQIHDIPKMVSLLTDDVRIGSLVFGMHIGADEATKYWEQLYQTFPDIKITPVTIIANENRLATEIDISGTERQRIGVSPAKGQGFRLRGAFIYEFVNDKIKEIRMYYDSTILLRHLERPKTADTEKTRA
jgi:steroid delta-isomerase-like uncharacterized protein